MGFGAAFIGIISLIFTYLIMLFYGGVIYQEPNLFILFFELSGAIIGFIFL